MPIPEEGFSPSFFDWTERKKRDGTCCQWKTLFFSFAKCLVSIPLSIFPKSRWKKKNLFPVAVISVISEKIFGNVFLSVCACVCVCHATAYALRVRNQKMTATTKACFSRSFSLASWDQNDAGCMWWPSLNPFVKEEKIRPRYSLSVSLSLEKKAHLSVNQKRKKVLLSSADFLLKGFFCLLCWLH